MNLHFSHDDKFLDYFIINAKKYSPAKNIFIVLTNNSHLTYTKSVEEVIIFPYDKEEVKKIFEKEIEIKNIYFHAFQGFFVDLIEDLELHKRYTLIWLFYGFEIFGMNYYKKKFFLPKNLKWYNFNESIKITFNLRVYLYKIKRRFQKKRQSKRLDNKLIRGIEKIHYIGHFIDEDFDKYIKPFNSRLQYISWNYFGIGFNALSAPQNLKNNFRCILGNSASEENNHLDAFHFLNKNFHNFGTIEIVVPLSYSGLPSYIDEVLAQGNKLLGDSFVPLLDFMPREQYLNYILTMDCAIYFNLRSQAAGNIIWFIEHNIPVFMHPRSTLYRFFINSGFSVFTVDSLNHFISNPNHFHSKILLNKKLLEEQFGDHAMKNKYISILEI